MNNPKALQQERPGALFVGPYPPPYGGISTHLLGLTAYLAENGYRSHVLTFTSGQRKVESVQEDLSVTRIPIRPTKRAAATLLRRTTKLPKVAGLIPHLDYHGFTSALLRSLHILEVAKRSGLHTVSIYGTHEGIVVPFLRRLHPNIRILYTVFAGPYFKPDYFTKHRHVYHLAAKEADIVLSSSHYCGGAVRRLAEDVSAEVIYYGVDLKRFHPSLERRLLVQYPLLKNKIVILFLARMEPEMGILHALAIARNVNAARDDTIFVLAGAKGSATNVVQEAAETSQGRIMCCTNIPGEELPFYYASADIVMAPTVDRWACMGLAIKEALATGRPVVTTNAGGIPEAVRDGVEGFIIPTTISGSVDEGEFAKAILDLSQDAQLRESMGCMARDRAVALFDAEDTNRKIIALLKG